MPAIAKRKNGYQCQIRLAGHPPQSRTFPTQAEAEKWGAETELLMRHGIVKPPRTERRRKTNTTLNTVAEMWERRNAPLSDKAHLQLLHLRRHEIHTMELEAINDEAAMGYKEYLLTKMQPPTATRILRLPIKLWQFAIDRMEVKLGRNPFEGLLDVKGKKRFQRVLPADFERIMAQCRREIIGDVCKMAVLTAMRRNEILSLREPDIIDGKFAFIQDTKTDMPRKIPLLPQAQELVAKRMKTSRGGLLFPIAPHIVANEFTLMRNVAGLPHIRFHDLRHEALTRFNEMGLSTFDIAAISGHSDINVLAGYINQKPEDVLLKLERDAKRGLTLGQTTVGS